MPHQSPQLLKMSMSSDGLRSSVSTTDGAFAHGRQFAHGSHETSPVHDHMELAHAHANMPLPSGHAHEHSHAHSPPPSYAGGWTGEACESCEEVCRTTDRVQPSVKPTLQRCVAFPSLHTAV
jgi:hypothetical protein